MSLGKDKKRFTLDIDNKIHTEIKVRATLRHTSIQNYILVSIAMRIVREDIVTQQEKQPVKAAVASKGGNSARWWEHCNRGSQ